MTAHKNTATLLVTCPDQKGIVAAIADFLLQHDANILHADQHQDAENNLFLMRVEWDLTAQKLMPRTLQITFLASHRASKWNGNSSLLKNVHV